MGSAHTYSGAAKWSRRRGYGLRKLFSLSWILTGKHTYWHGYGLRKLFSLSWILTGKPTYGHGDYRFMDKNRFSDKSNNSIVQGSWLS